MYLPGYYLGGRLPPFLRAKTKAGGYFLLITGVIALISSYTLILNNQISLENIGGIVIILYGVLAIMVGVKFINKKEK